MPIETRYMTTDRHTVNGLTAYKLALTQTALPLSCLVSDPDLYDEIRYGIRVFIRRSGGSEIEVTGGVPVAVVIRIIEGDSIMSATWNCPEYNLFATDAILVRVYGNIDLTGWFQWYQNEGTSPPYNPAEFITEQLGGATLDATTWTVYYFTSFHWQGGLDLYRFQFGHTSYNSRIEGFSWTSGAPAVVPQLLIDGLVIVKT